jgi:hypothetical protein
MTATEVLDAVERAGGSLALNGAQIKYTMPKEAAWLLHELKQNRKDLIELLRENGTPDATWRSAAEMGTENPSSCGRPHGDR